MAEPSHAACHDAPSECACSNISIMQLFHELKQEFPALPDHVVSDCISAHCHDRPRCTATLQEATRGMTQAAYPAQALRRAPPPPSPSGSCNASRRPSGDGAVTFKNVKDQEQVQFPKCNSDSDNANISESENETKCAKGLPPKRKGPPPQRPTTLQFAAPGTPPRRPVRHAPPPPKTPPKEEQFPVNVSLNVNCSVGLVSPSRPPRHTSALNVQPEPAWSREVQSPRSFTSVNLTLRTPTSSPQSPIDLQAGPSLSYSTSSYDARQGFQSRLQITVGPSGAGSVSAVRTRPRSTYTESAEPLVTPPVARAESLPNVLSNLTPEEASTIQRQIARRELLAAELATERGRLQAMQREVRGLEIPGLAQGPATVLRLKQEIQTLQGQCETMAQQVDRYCGPPVPLGETSEEFYQNIYTGQQAIIRPREPPPRPPPPRLPEGPPWTCHLCTFRNHPLLDKCEQCEMPRILLVSASPGEDIHIHLTPGQNRVIHSWVV